MGNPVLDRIQSQIRPVLRPLLSVNVIEHIISPPVDLEKLFNLLVEALTEPLPVIAPVPTSRHFGNIFDFAAWYAENKTAFSPEQQTALDTLVQTRDMVFQGCNCKQPQREFAAADYFKTFWMNNATTDMLPAVAKALNVTHLQFGNFLSFPS